MASHTRSTTRKIYHEDVKNELQNLSCWHIRVIHILVRENDRERNYKHCKIHLQAEEKNSRAQYSEQLSRCINFNSESTDKTTHAYKLPDTTNIENRKLNRFKSVKGL